jgi:hypothetical protein
VSRWNGAGTGGNPFDDSDGRKAWHPGDDGAPEETEHREQDALRLLEFLYIQWMISPQRTALPRDAVRNAAPSHTRESSQSNKHVTALYKALDGLEDSQIWHGVHAAFRALWPDTFLQPPNHSGRWLALSERHARLFDPERFDLHLSPSVTVNYPNGLSLRVVYLQPVGRLYHGSPDAHPDRPEAPAARSTQVIGRNNFFGNRALATEYATNQGKTGGLLHTYEWRNPDAPVPLVAIDEYHSIRSLLQFVQYWDPIHPARQALATALGVENDDNDDWITLWWNDIFPGSIPDGEMPDTRRV